MRMKQFLSLLMALALVVSSAAIATAESTDTTTAETMVADDGTETTETVEATETVYTLEEMLTLAMTDAYERQATYAAYAEAFSGSRSISNLSVDSQIVLLEMLLKANGIALPEVSADVTVPETKAEAYQAIAEAESNVVTTLKSYLEQGALTEDAQLIFAMVLNDSSDNASTFIAKARTAQRAQELQEMQELISSSSTKTYVVQSSGSRGNRTVTVYVVADEEADEETDEATEDTQEDTTEETDDSAEEGTGN